jgi:hypothetical protein
MISSERPFLHIRAKVFSRKKVFLRQANRDCFSISTFQDVIHKYRKYKNLPFSAAVKMQTRLSFA